MKAPFRHSTPLIRIALALLVFASLRPSIPEPSQPAEESADPLKEERADWLKNAQSVNLDPVYEISVSSAIYDKIDSQLHGMVHLGEPFWFEASTGADAAAVSGIVRKGDSAIEFVGSYKLKGGSGTITLKLNESFGWRTVPGIRTLAISLTPHLK